MTRELAETRMSRLQALWQDFAYNDEALRNCDDVDPGHDYFTKDVLDDTQDVYDWVYDLYVQFVKTQPIVPVSYTHLTLPTIYSV